MSMILLAAAEAENAGGPSINPYVVGVIALVILTALMLAMLSFGKGREHS